MKNSVEKSLYFLGISIMIIFLAILMVISFFDQRPAYTLMIYNSSNEALEPDFYKDIQDPQNKINGYSMGVPDDRIHVANTPLFVLVKTKNREIIYVTDSLDKLNEFITHELK